QKNRAEMHMQNRKAPTARLMRKTGLISYTNKGPLVSERISVTGVTIPLKQHIGAPCVPVVQVGQPVNIGQTIAVRAVGQDGKPALGADIHASINGTVRSIGAEIVIG
ncbi:MAG: hypothetical protein ACRC2T_07175, partial [Thermoguttaceae bacterium]